VPFTFQTKCFYPFCGACTEFRVILIFPSPSYPFQSLHLPEALKFPFGSLDQETAAGAFADYPIDLVDKRLGNDNVGS